MRRNLRTHKRDTSLTESTEWRIIAARVRAGHAEKEERRNNRIPGAPTRIQAAHTSRP